MPRSDKILPKPRWVQLSQGALFLVMVGLAFWKFPGHSWVAVVAAAAGMELEVISQRPRGLSWRWIFANLVGGLLALALICAIEGADAVIYFRIQDAFDEDITSIAVLIAATVTVLGVFLLLWQIGYTLLPRAKPAPPPDKAAPAPRVAPSPPAAAPPPAPPSEPGPPYQLDPALLRLAYRSETIERQGKNVQFSVRDIGLLEITSGRVAASDPLVMPNPAAFTRAVPNGPCPVRIAIAHIGTDQRIAYAEVLFSDAAPVSWEMAVTREQDPATLGKDEFFGYPVDAGTGCFMDARAGRLLEARMDSEEAYYNTIIDEMDDTYVHTRSWANIRPDPQAKENVICFSTGYGDGSYPSFFGLDAEGNVAVLVTDFFVAGDD